MTDYRDLNNVTIPDSYPLPRIDTTIDFLAGRKWFSTMDLRWGFWQIPIKEEDKHLTAFCTPHGLFEYNKLPFGLRNSPPTFQRVVDAVLAGLKYSFCLVYVDDIIVFSDEFDEHLDHLSQVLTRIEDAGLRAKLEKCNFAVHEIRFLGKRVNGQGVAVDEAKVSKILEVPPPRDKPALQRFLGMCVYHHKHIDGYGRIARPLYDLIGDTAEWKWGKEENDAYEEMKQALNDAAVLEFPEEGCPLVLRCDASKRGIGAALYKVKDKKNIPLAFICKTLTTSETHYSNTEREGLAVAWAVTKLEYYLWGKPFTVETDHNALLALAKNGDLSGRWARWRYALQDYDLTLKHRGGKTASQGVPDFLSRALLEDTRSVATQTEDFDAPMKPTLTKNEDPPQEVYFMDPSGNVEVTSSEPTSVELVLEGAFLAELREEQENDPFIQKYLRFFKDGVIDEVDSIKRDIILKAISEFTVEGGVLYRIFDFHPRGYRQRIFKQAVIPESMRRRCMELCHDDIFAGHLGRDKSITRLRQTFWWPDWHSHITNHVSTCEKCNRTRPELPKTARGGDLEPIVVGDVWETIGIDILGPLPITKKNKYKYVLMIIDYVSKFPFAIPLRQITAPAVARALVEKVFTTFGVPQKIISDRGQPFISKLQLAILKLLGITPAFTSPYHPSSNGLTERSIKTLSGMIRSYVNEYTHDDWDVQLPYILFAFRSSHQASTLEAPFYLMFGREPPLPGFLWQQSQDPSEPWDNSVTALRTVSDLRAEVVERLQKAWDLTRANLKKAQAQQKKWHNAHSTHHEFQLGDRVWLAIPQFRKSTNLENASAVKKFSAKWSGPHRIVGIGENGLTFKLMEVLSAHEVIHRQAHLRRLRPYTARRPVDPKERFTLDEGELLTEELALAKQARHLQKVPFRPRAYGTSRELTRRGIDPDKDSDEEGSDIDATEEWEIDKILKHSLPEDGERDFLVKWKNHNAAHNQWIPASDLNPPALLRQYYKAHNLPLEELEDINDDEVERNDNLESTTSTVSPTPSTLAASTKRKAQPSAKAKASTVHAGTSAPQPPMRPSIAVGANPVLPPTQPQPVLPPSEATTPQPPPDDLSLPLRSRLRSAKKGVGE